MRRYILKFQFIKVFYLRGFKTYENSHRNNDRSSIRDLNPTKQEFGQS
jgi:hypothetical protein